jgi:hypothetical protein
VNAGLGSFRASCGAIPPGRAIAHAEGSRLGHEQSGQPCEPAPPIGRAGQIILVGAFAFVGRQEWSVSGVTACVTPSARKRRLARITTQRKLEKEIVMNWLRSHGEVPWEKYCCNMCSYKY